MYQKIATMATGQSDSAFTFKTAGAAPNLRHLSLSLYRHLCHVRSSVGW